MSKDVTMTFTKTFQTEEGERILNWNVDVKMPKGYDVFLGSGDCKTDQLGPIFDGSDYNSLKGGIRVRFSNATGWFGKYKLVPQADPTQPLIPVLAEKSLIDFGRSDVLEYMDDEDGYE